MKTYLVTYSGNSTKFSNFETTINANSEREAVEDVYSEYLNENYFPDENGNIYDCDGNLLAEANDDLIEYDGGYFSADEYNEDEE